MRRIWIAALLLVGGALAPRPADAAKPLKIVCTLSDLGWLAEQVAGPEGEVKSLCPGDFDPHFLPAKPSLARTLGKADLLCYSGLELEVGWLPVLMEKARNRRIRPGEPGELDCSRAVTHVLDIPMGEVSRAQGDVHPDGNPHYLLDPRNGIAVARLMAERMAALRPEAAAGFHERADRVQRELEERIAAWEGRAAALRGQPVVQYHQQWEYLTDWLGLEIIGSVEHRPGIAPSPRHVAELASEARERGAHLLLAAPWNHLDAAAKAAERMDGRLVVLPPAVGAVEGAGTYPGMFDVIIGDLTRDDGKHHD